MKRKALNERVSNNGIFWIILVIIITVIFFGLSIRAGIYHFYEIQGEGKYSVKVSNWIGSTSFCCESYIQTNNCYKFYDIEGNLIKEIFISDGYIIKIERR